MNLNYRLTGSNSYVGTTSWEKLTVPAGSSSHQWTIIHYSYGDEDSSYNESSNKLYKGGRSGTQYLFYINSAGGIEYIEQGKYKQTGSSYDDYYGAYDGQPYLEWDGFGDTTPKSVAIPNGVKFQKIFTVDSQIGGGYDVVYDRTGGRNSYLTCTTKASSMLPTIYAVDITGKCWVGSAQKSVNVTGFSPFKNNRYSFNSTYPPDFTDEFKDSFAITAADYVWVESDIVELWTAIAPSTDSAYGLTSIDGSSAYAIDKNGNFLLIAGEYPNVTKTVIASGDFVSHKMTEDSAYMYLIDTAGTYWLSSPKVSAQIGYNETGQVPCYIKAAYISSTSIAPISLGEIVPQYFVEVVSGTANTKFTPHTLNVSNHTVATLKDEQNRYWQVCLTKNCDSTPQVLYDPDSKIVKSQHGTLDGYPFFAHLLENGEIWLLYAGNHSYSETFEGVNYERFYHSSVLGPYKYGTNYAPIKVSGTHKFVDMIMGVSFGGSAVHGNFPQMYSLAMDEEGNVYRTGYTSGAGGILNDQNYDGFMLTETADWNTTYKLYTKHYVSQKETPFFAGYHYEDTLYGCMFQREDHVFLNWNQEQDNRGALLYPGDLLEIEGPTTLYAQWEPVCNKVRYHPNGGSGSLMEDTVTAPPAGNKVTLRKNTYYLGGHIFNGWNTKPDGTGTSYADGAEFIMKDGTTILYAQWKKMDKYTIKVAENEEDVRPVTISSQKKLEYNQMYRIPDALAERTCTVGYRINGDTYQTLQGMSTTPKWVTSQPFTEEYTKAVQKFLHWMLYEEEEANEKYNYLHKFYLPGSKANQMTRNPSYASVLFPLWSGKDSEVKLPSIQCDGYSLIGWSESATDKDDNFVYAPEGGGYLYKPMKANTLLYAHYEPREYKIELIAEVDGTASEDIIQEQKTVWMTFDKVLPSVIPPESSVYTFMGYYDKLDEDGLPTEEAIMYYDASGNPALDTNGEPLVWRIHDKSVMKLYAYLSEEPYGMVKEPEEPVTVQGGGKGAMVQVYADDKNSFTGAETDELPYYVADYVTEEGSLEQGAIPSTEPVVVRAKLDAYMVSCRFEQKNGVEMIRAHVTVPYRTQYENPKDGSLVVSERKTKTVQVLVPKAWSYWELAEGGVYFPEKVVVKNKSLAGESIELPVQWNTSDATKKPEYEVTVYGEKEQHISFDSYDEDGTPSMYVTVAGEEYIVSSVPGQMPAVDKQLLAAAKKAARKEPVQLTVRSDEVKVAGVTLLSDEPSADGNGAKPQQEVMDSFREIIPETAYSQIYCSGILLDSAIANGRYETESYAIYRLAEQNTRESVTKSITVTENDAEMGAMEGWDTIEVPIEKTNEINIHTPVVCLPELAGNHEELYQGKELPEDGSILVLDEEGRYSEFILFVNNVGYHSEKRGYKDRDYAEFLARKDGNVRNEVCFPFEVWLDTGNDNIKENDCLIPAGEWYGLGAEKQRFYLPVTIKEGDYEFAFRSVAINGEGMELSSEWVRNTKEENYVAENRLKVYVVGRLFGFNVTGINGTDAWDEITKKGLCYTVGPKPPEYSLRDTLPLRKGVHPVYRNLGGLPRGGTLSFSVKSVGVLCGEGATVQAEPHLFVMENGRYRDVDVYYEEETEKGTILRQWNPEEQRLFLEGREEKTGMWQWNGVFTLPKKLYVTEKGTDVWSYRKLHGLSFTESFWLEDCELMLRFALQLKTSKKELLYYGMIPEEIVNNIWKIEAEVSYREDYDKRNFQIFGGETAVIYPGESISVGQMSHGIY